MKSKLKILSIVMVSAALLSISSYVAFAINSDLEVKKERLEKFKIEYREKQRKIEVEISAMPRNSEEDRKKIREAEGNLKNMRMSPEADQLIQELATRISEQPKKNLETRFFYSRDGLHTAPNYAGYAKLEKNPVIKEKYEKSAKIMEQKKSLLNQIEKDFKEGKGTFEEWNKRLDELMAIDECK